MKKKLLPARRWIYCSAIVLIVFWSIVTGALNVGVFYLFGIPLFGLLAGLILLWFADVDVKRKIIFTLAPIPIFYVTALTFFELNKAEPETFLVPAERRGEIVILYDEPCGEPPIYENGRRIYKIPADGILITSFKENKGHLDQIFYLLDENGKTKEIPRFHWQDFETEQENWKYFHSIPVTELTMDSTGVFQSYGSSMIWISKNSFSYIVSDYRYFEKDRDELNRKQRLLESETFAKAAKNRLEECEEKLESKFNL